MRGRMRIYAPVRTTYVVLRTVVKISRAIVQYFVGFMHVCMCMGAHVQVREHVEGRTRHTAGDDLLGY